MKQLLLSVSLLAAVNAAPNVIADYTGSAIPTSRPRSAAATP